MGEKESYVHHSSSIDHTRINVEPLRHGFMNVHLGFLRIHQRYRVEFLIPWNGCWHQKEDESSPQAVRFGEQNPYCRIIEFVRDKDYLLRLRVELYIHDENVLKEQLQISCCSTGAPLTMFMRARVVGVNDGPPILREGVRHIDGMEELGNRELSSPDSGCSAVTYKNFP